MPVSHEKTAEEYKAEGNQLYTEGKLEEACGLYEAALELEPGVAVYYSNKSACLFELGSYDECIEETRRALALLTGEGGESTQAETSLKVKLWRRLAVALLYQVYSTFEQDVCGVAAEIRDLIFKVEDVEGIGKDARLLEVAHVLAWHEEQDRGAGGRCTEGGEEEEEGEGGAALLPRRCLPRLRPPLITAIREYYAVGHDEPTSGLRAAYENPSPQEQHFAASADLDPLARPKGKRDVSLLFGGCGDCRNFFATLIDVWQRLDRHCGLGEDDFGDTHRGGNREKEREGGSPQLILHVALNDIKPESVARSVLMLMAFENLNKAFNRAAANHAAQGRKLTVLQATREDGTVKSLLRFVTRLFLGACISELDDRLLQNMLTKALEAEDESDLIPFIRMRGGRKQWQELKKVYRSWLGLRERVSVATAYRCYKEYNDHKPSDTAEELGLLATDATGRIHQQVQRERDFPKLVRMKVNTMSIKETLPAHKRSLNVQQMREAAIEHLLRFSLDEIHLIGRFNGLRDELAVHKDCGLLLFDGEEQGFSGQHPSQWHRSWRANVTLVAEDWFELVGTQDIYIFRAFETLTSLAKGAVRSAAPLKSLKALEMAATFFLGAARGLHYLTATDGSALGSLTLEMDLGEIHAMFETEDEQGGPGRRFDRISISNICDYTTLLPSFLTLLPTLKTPGEGCAPSTLNHTILLGTGMYTDLEDYVERTVGVPDARDKDACAALLGARHCGGGLWKGHVHWTDRRPSVQQRRKAMQQLDSWLHSLFRSICLPPHRPIGQICTENKPLTLRVLFDVLVHLCDLDYPPHSLSLLLSSLLSRPPSRSSMNILSLCQTELRALCNIYAPLLPFPVSPFLVTQPPGPTRQYRLCINGMYHPGRLRPGNAATTPVLGAMLLRTSRGGGEGREEEGVWRGQDEDVTPFLEKSAGVRLLSVISWDSETRRLTFIMGQEDFDSLLREGGWGVRLWRNDGYVFESSRAPLKHAERV